MIDDCVTNRPWLILSRNRYCYTSKIHNKTDMKSAMRCTGSGKPQEPCSIIQLYNHVNRDSAQGGLHAV